MTGIYKITNPRGEVYIGQSRNIVGRLRIHRNSKTKSSISQSIQKYGFYNHKAEVLIVLKDGCSVKSLDFFEKHYISFSKLSNIPLLNKMKGGGGMTDEVRNGISLKKTGILRSQYKGEGNPFYGKSHTLEFRAKMSEHNKAHKTGTNNGRHRNIIQYDLNGNFIKEWDTVTNASKGLGINRLTISGCLRGQVSRAKGFIFKYKVK